MQEFAPRPAPCCNACVWKDAIICVPTDTNRAAVPHTIRVLPFRPMSGLMERDKARARRKGLLATATGTTGAVLLATATAPVLGVIGLGVGAVLAVDWFMFRARRGMRF